MTDELAKLLYAEFGTKVEYIGDGAYVGTTDFNYVIFTADGYTITNRVHIEPRALQALNKFIEDYPL